MRAEPVDVGFEHLPSIGSETAGAIGWVTDDRGSRSKPIRVQVANPLTGDLPAESDLDVRNGGALIQSGVTELRKVLGAEIVVIVLVNLDVGRVMKTTKLPPATESKDTKDTQSPQSQSLESRIGRRRKIPRQEQ